MIRGTVPIALLNFGVAILQLLFFVPMVAGGSGYSFGEWIGGGPLFRVDALALCFGVAWAVSLGLGLLVQQNGDTLFRAQAALLTVGLLTVAYAREPLVLLVGWEIGALGAYLGYYRGRENRARLRMAAFLHVPGVLVLVPAALGWMGAFEPPAGGAAYEWPLAVTLLVGMAVYTRILYKPAGLPERAVGGWLSGLYAVCAPFVLAKMLVGGRWDAWGTWALALVGTGVLIMLAWEGGRREVRGTRVGQALAILCVVGLALAAVSPMAGLGAVVLLALAALVAGVEGKLQLCSYRGAMVLAGGVAGLWLISQGALAARYGVVAVVALPTIMVVMSGHAPGEEAGRSSRVGVGVAAVIALIVGLGAVYPQAVVEWVARPAVQAMAGGVGAPTDLARNWGVGLQVVSPAELVLASLPATGMALAVFVAWVVLYWLKRMVDGGRGKT
jgi:hypothetical protein